jgi:hypothetical protein
VVSTVHTITFEELTTALSDLDRVDTALLTKKSFGDDRVSLFDQERMERLFQDVNLFYNALLSDSAGKPKTSLVAVGDKRSGKSDLLRSLLQPWMNYVTIHALLSSFTEYCSDIAKEVPAETAYQTWKPIARAVRRLVENRLMQEGRPLGLRWPSNEMQDKKLLSRLQEAGYRITLVVLFTKREEKADPTEMTLPVSNFKLKKVFSTFAPLSDVGLLQLFAEKHLMNSMLFFYGDHKSPATLGCSWHRERKGREFEIVDDKVYPQILEGYSRICTLCKPGTYPQSFGSLVGKFSLKKYA